jgi:hypothetical protein
MFFSACFVGLLLLRERSSTRSDEAAGTTAA